MREGWLGDIYWCLFAEEEVSATSLRYGIADFLPGFSVLGLRGWDDFLVRDGSGAVFTVPTVPLDARYLEPASPPPAGAELVADARLAGRIKWYVKPLVFGGDPQAEDNLVWVGPEKHAQLVRWWNGQYRAARPNEGRPP